jgi:hypothetical protein
MKKVKKLLEVGVDGGGAEIFLMSDGSVADIGSAGGMLDEDEDEIRSWKKLFPNFEAYWEDFKKSNGDFWVMFYPLFIDEDVKEIIRTSVDAFESEDNWGVKTWKERLEQKDFF